MFENKFLVAAFLFKISIFANLLIQVAPLSGLALTPQHPQKHPFPIPLSKN